MLVSRLAQGLKLPEGRRWQRGHLRRAYTYLITWLDRINHPHFIINTNDGTRADEAVLITPVMASDLTKTGQAVRRGPYPRT